MEENSYFEGLYKKALSIIEKKSVVTTSFVQRELKIGYVTAAKLIDAMEEAGVISEANHVGKRKVIVKPDNQDNVADILIEEEANRIDEEKSLKPDLPGIGHNSDNVKETSSARLKSFIERIERLEEEKAALAEDIKEIYGEAKAVGYDTKTIRKIVRLRKTNVEKRREEEELLELYKAALGME